MYSSCGSEAGQGGSTEVIACMDFGGSLGVGQGIDVRRQAPPTHVTVPHPKIYRVIDIIVTDSGLDKVLPAGRSLLRC